MIKIKKAAASLAAVIVSVLLGFGVGIAPASAATQIGGISVWQYCQDFYGPGYEAYLLEENVFGWRCLLVAGFGHDMQEVDMNRQCYRQYGSSAYAKYTDFNNPYSWKCYR